MRFDLLPQDKSLQSKIFRFAIDEAFEETEKYNNGQERIRAINDVLIKKTKTYEGVAQDMHYDQRTIQGWITSFVNLVGKKAGY